MTDEITNLVIGICLLAGFSALMISFLLESWKGMGISLISMPVSMLMVYLASLILKLRERK